MSCGRCCSLQLVGELPINVRCISQNGALGSFALNSPGTAIPHNGHPVSYPPPLIDLRGKRKPDVVLLAKFPEITQQVLIDGPCFPGDDVVWMNNETGQSMLLENQFGLRLPEIYGALVEQMKQGVILGCGYRKFKNVTDEVRHYCATTTALWIEVSDIRNGHVERKIKVVV